MKKVKTAVVFVAALGFASGIIGCGSGGDDSDNVKTKLEPANSTLKPSRNFGGVGAPAPGAGGQKGASKVSTE